MKNSLCFAALFAALLLAGNVQARDTRVEVSLQSVLDLGLSNGTLDDSVKFYLAGASTPAIQRQLGEGVSNKKTNAANKSDEEACRWVALTTLKAFHASAKKRGANAVVNLVSYYKKNTWKDAEMIECHAGTLMAGVALKGEYALIAD